MFLTPGDVRQKTLKTRLGKYDREEVDRLLAAVAASYEEVWQERDELRDRVGALRGGLAHFTELDVLTQEAVLGRQREAERRLAEAESKAEGIVTAAQGRASRIVEDAEAERERLEKEVERLRTLQHEIQTSYRAFVLAALELLDGSTDRTNSADGQSAVEAHQ